MVTERERDECGTDAQSAGNEGKGSPVRNNVAFPQRAPWYDAKRIRVRMITLTRIYHRLYGKKDGFQTKKKRFLKLSKKKKNAALQKADGNQGRYQESVVGSSALPFFTPTESWSWPLLMTSPPSSSLPSSWSSSSSSSSYSLSSDSSLIALKSHSSSRSALAGAFEFSSFSVIFRIAGADWLKLREEKKWNHGLT